MKKRVCSVFLVLAMSLSLMTACGAGSQSAGTSQTQSEAGGKTEENIESDEIEETKEIEKTEEVEETSEDTDSAQKEKIALEDGIYTVDFETDSTMFHINEVYDNKAQMTVKDGEATAHIVLASTHILNLFPGSAEDAQKEGAVLLEPVTEEVLYPDGTTDEANAFDVPVPVIDEEFDLALIGSKGIWYDHKVKVTNVVSAQESTEDTVLVSLEGGSGKASIESPAHIEKTEEGYLLTVTWSSPYYDYMVVDGNQYLPINTEGNSVFEIPVSDFSQPLSVIADTTAMSQPHEIEYTITFD